MKHFSVWDYKKKDVVNGIKARALFCDCCKETFYNERWKRMDHNHSNGELRGVVCPSCNIRIGTVEAPLDITAYKHVYAYLLRHRQS